MPRVGSVEVDVRTVRMIHDWIAGMPPAKASSPRELAAIPAEDRAALDVLRSGDRATAEARSAAIRRLTSSTRGALLLLGLINRGGASESTRREVATVARENPAIEVRDLFERFIPEGERVKRLGDVIDRVALLTLRGDAARGRSVFTANPAAQCKSCHKVGGIGESVGPDLTKIGAKYDRAALLDQILNPSRTIDPQYVSYMLETKDGRVLTGLVVEKIGARGGPQGRAGQDDARPQRRGRTARVPAAIAHARALAPRPDGPAGGGPSRVFDDLAVNPECVARSHSDGGGNHAG